MRALVGRAAGEEAGFAEHHHVAHVVGGRADQIDDRKALDPFAHRLRAGARLAGAAAGEDQPIDPVALAAAIDRAAPRSASRTTRLRAPARSLRATQRARSASASSPSLRERSRQFRRPARGIGAPRLARHACALAPPRCCAPRARISPDRRSSDVISSIFRRRRRRVARKSHGSDRGGRRP